MPTVYRWRPGSRVQGLDAQVAGEALEAIRLNSGGELTPAAVVDASRPRDAPLHGVFEWRDKVAAAKFREVQAGHLIRAVAVQFERGAEQEPLETRAFVSVVEDDSRGYTSVTVAMADPELRRQVVENALRELRTWRQRYAHYEELAQMFAALDAVDKAAA